MSTESPVIFVDTGAWLASVVPWDANHAAAAAWEVFRTFDDKDWSFTDCTSKVAHDILSFGVRPGGREREKAVQTQLYLTPKDHGRPVTEEEFEHADGQEGYRYELIDGRVEVSPSPDFPHEDIRDVLRRHLERYAEQHPEVINKVMAPVRVFVPGRRATTVPEPDIAAYRDFPIHLPRSRIRWRDHTPLLVVEVLSEGNADKDLVRNRKLYLQVPSIREYWIIDPRADADHPSMTVYRRRRDRWQRPIEVAVGETYTTRLLPGFTLTLAEANEV